MLKICEVFQKQVRCYRENPDGSQYVHFEQAFQTRDVLLNKRYIVAVHPYEFSSSMDLEKVEASFPTGTKFVKVVVDGNSFRSSEIIATGSFEKFCATLEGNTS